MVPLNIDGSTRKKRHLSKKNKVSWRKNVDIQDVEDFLDDKRLEERLGTPFADKPDSELFVVDTLPSAKSVKAASGLTRQSGLTTRQRKRLELQEVPKCFQSLVNISKVGDPSGKRNHVRPVTLSKLTEQKKMRSGIYKKKFDMAEKNRALNRKNKRDLKECRTNITKDIWGEEAVTAEKPAPPSEWLTRDTRDCNKPRIQPPRPPRYAAKSAPVVAPHPGASYNPNFKDHQELLQEVVRQELKVMKEERHLNRVTSAMFRKVTAKEKMEEDMRELRQGLDEEGAASEGSGDEYRSVNPPVRNRKKDLRKKRHMREERMSQAMAKVDAREKRKLADVYKLKFLQKSVVDTEVKQKHQRTERLKRRLEAPPAPRINSTTYVEPAPVYVESQELTGNLRNLVPTGGGLAEHFVSLQRRGLASVSKPNTLKVAKRKRYTITEHKLPWEIKEGPVKPSKRNKK